MGMYIHGIAASQNIDSSGERIIVEGMDISSLAVDGTFNYEHEAATTPDGKKITIKLPSLTVGKVLKAKKIFSEKDCEDEHQAYFWSKVQVPYVYVMGELFDEFKESSKEVAAMFAYDESKKGKQERNVMNFSVEGQYIARNGMDVIKSIARKVTITVLPCNKAAIAEMVAAPGQKEKNDIDSLFKTESVEIEIIKFDKKSQLEALIKKEDVSHHAKLLGLAPLTKDIGLRKTDTAPTNGTKPKLSVVGTSGTKIGTTQSGQEVHSHGMVHEYSKFGAQDHRDAATAHYNAAAKAKSHPLARHHRQKGDLHQSKANTIMDRQSRTGMSKAMDTGSGMAAPGQLVQGAALSVESLERKKRKELFKKAEDLYNSWGEKEAFESFMQKRMPNLHKGEMEAIGKALALKKSQHADKIPGGLADKKKPEDFDSEALKEGVKIELEHTSDHAIAQEIAMDHLTEDRHYYKKLKTIEKSSRPAFLPYDQIGQSSSVQKKEE